jgi:DNA-binding NtrC family response regulator
VDDESDTRDLIADFCRALGHRVTVEADGVAAVEALLRDTARYDVVVTDLHMPGADGFDVLRATSRSRTPCYVVIVTGYATLETAVRAVREGAYDYLPKPFSLGQLELVFTRIEERRQLEQERNHLRQQVSLTRTPPPGGDLGWRLAAIEERLGSIETLLKQRLD